MTFYRTISQQALETIRNDIIQGALKPGEKLNESALAARYQISRTPLRDAIRQLQMEGLLEVAPNKGARVAALIVSEVKDFFEARQILEGYVIHHVCQHISDVDIHRLQIIVTTLKENHYVANYLDNHGLFAEFYTILHKNCPNTHLRQSLEIMIRKMGPLRFILVKTKGAIHVYERLSMVASALSSKDSAAAEAAICNTIEAFKTVTFDEILKAHPTYFRE